MTQRGILILLSLVFCHFSFAQSQTPINSSNLTPPTTVEAPPPNQFFILTIVRNIQLGTNPSPITPMCPPSYCAGIYCGPSQFGTSSADSAIYSLVVQPSLFYTNCTYNIQTEPVTNPQSTTYFQIDCVVFCQYQPTGYCIGSICPGSGTTFCQTGDPCTREQFTSRST